MLSPIIPTNPTSGNKGCAKTGMVLSEETKGTMATVNEPSAGIMEVGDETSTFGDESTPKSEERDEVDEVRKIASRDTTNVLLLRSIVVVSLVATAVCVTWTTYMFLSRQQNDNFESQFEQFSRTVADAALSQQKRARVACRGLADAVTSYAQSTEANWPFFEMPLFERYAQNAIDQAGVEAVSMFPKVRHEQYDEYMTFINSTYEDMVNEHHLIRYGDFDALTPADYHPYISASGGFPPDIERDFYFPSTHFTPAPRTYGFINWNVYSDPIYQGMINNLLEMKTVSVISPVKPYSAAAGIAFTDEEHAAMHQHVYVEDASVENPHSFMIVPVFGNIFDLEPDVVGVLVVPFGWDVFMVGLLPKGVNGIVVVLENDCGQTYTYEVDGPAVRFIGEGDHHETKYDGMELHQDLQEGFDSHPLYYDLNDHCRFGVHIYPSTRFEDSLDPFTPEIFAIVVATTFAMITILFYLYDMFVQRRNEKLVVNAAKSNAIVSSLFPSNIRDRLVNQDSGPSTKKRSSLKNFMVGSNESERGTSGELTGGEKKPLADLFTECTICFADIAGFTAWSSVREPAHVFLLLESIYGAFDRTAKQRRVFKIETVGDCYVAATGIPDFRKDHAVLMVRFARDMLASMSSITKELETTLGPDTGDLSLRVGIHTGPVTAGVLRGDRARFQLFGDTMNVCSRVESTGVAGRIQVSSETAENLRQNRRGHWLIKREGTVAAKGKGEIQTYWIGMGVDSDRRGSSISGSSVAEQFDSTFLEPVENGVDVCGDAKMTRLVEWNVKMLSQILKQVIARRTSKSAERRHDGTVLFRRDSTDDSNFIPLDEVVEIVRLPKFDPKVAKTQDDPEEIVLSPNVVGQLRLYVQTITAMYNDNSFHNFEHASHVTMSVVKLLSRIVAPTEILEDGMPGKGRSVYATMHDHTYGITSDPLTQFSCAFAAMIHDVDHTGVPNAQLVKEGSRVAYVYNNRSVAEQNSLVMAWEILMMEDYNELRTALCSTGSELERFRQLVVNAVMATDIADAELKKLRNARWKKAFDVESGVDEDVQTAVNRKATIVIEHLIQASDVAHTMQHWHVYRKWNEKFFRECYKAYKDGRAATDPSEGWYKGELGFFDFYIIPLAKKLKECGVFGKSSDEYLNYALANRSEWEARGQEVVAEMMEAMRSGL